MKKTIFTLAILMMASGAALVSCETPAEKVEDSQTKVDEKQLELDKAKAEHAEQYRKFREDAEDEIIANDQLIEELKVYSKDKKKDAKAAYEKQIDELEARNEKLREKLNEEKGEDHEKWESFKREFKHDMNELKESLQDLGKNNVK